jgi:hypothetical protein
MSYEYHNEDECDKCMKNVGKKNLLKVPFLYLDCGDVHHKDEGKNYRQYYICKECMKQGF